MRNKEPKELTLAIASVGVISGKHIGGVIVNHLKLLVGCGNGKRGERGRCFLDLKLDPKDGFLREHLLQVGDLGVNLIQPTGSGARMTVSVDAGKKTNQPPFSTPRCPESRYHVDKQKSTRHPPPS